MDSVDLAKARLEVVATAEKVERVPETAAGIVEALITPLPVRVL